MVADQARLAVGVAVAVTSALAALVAGSAVGPADLGEVVILACRAVEGAGVAGSGAGHATANRL